MVMRQMVVENLVVREVTFRFFVWGNNPATDLKVGCQNKEHRSAFGYIIFDDVLVLLNNLHVLPSSGVMSATCVTIAEVDDAEIWQQNDL